MGVSTVSSDPRESTSSRSFSTTAHERRSADQTPKVKGDATEHSSYILTLSTDDNHYQSMKALRNTYFPPRLNKIPAHLTLFHALPGDRLDDQVLPAIESLVAETPSYRIRATHPFRMSKGIGIAVADDIDHPRSGPKSRNLTQQIHERLRKSWGGWLSPQDSAPLRTHYTVMNKVSDDADVDRALAEVEESFKEGKVTADGRFQFKGDKALNHGHAEAGASKGDKIVREGEVQGLILWKYEEGGRWKFTRGFKFKGTDKQVEHSDTNNDGNEEKPTSR